MKRTTLSRAKSVQQHKSRRLELLQLEGRIAPGDLLFGLFGSWMGGASSLDNQFLAAQKPDSQSYVAAQEDVLRALPSALATSLTSVYTPGQVDLHSHAAPAGKENTSFGAISFDQFSRDVWTIDYDLLGDGHSQQPSRPGGALHSHTDDASGAAGVPSATVGRNGLFPDGPSGVTLGNSSATERSGNAAPGDAAAAGQSGNPSGEDGPGIVMRSTGPPVITIVADTNRDGAVTDTDLPGRETWTRDSGAIFAVNFDDDNTDGQPDAIAWNDQGRPTGENFVIENFSDSIDLAPVVIKAMGPGIAGKQVYLVVPSVEDAQSIHVFPSLNPGTTSILGRAGTRAVGGTAAETVVDITAYISATEDVTFGVEGLLFRNTGTSNPALTFDGTVDLTIRVRDGETVIGEDSVRMKVAPWIMATHTQASERVYAANAGAQNASLLFNTSADPGYFGLDNSGQLFTYPYSAGTNNQWTQDHGEFGYTQRPGGPPTQVFFRLPYDRGTGVQPTWPTGLLAPDVGIFQLGNRLPVTPLAGAGDYGGNVEALPPTPSHPLGRTILGDSGSSALFTFFQSQEVQPSFQLPTRWLIVSHLDEIIGFSPNPGEVIIADTYDAYARMNAIPVEERGAAVYFATGQKPQAVTVSEVAPTAFTGTRIYTGIDHRGQSWRYLRIYDSSASSSNSAGQVARIATNGLQDGYIVIDRVWNTTTRIGGSTTVPSAQRWSLAANAPAQGTWFTTPQASDKFVLVDGTRFWNSDTTGTPAIVTVHEVLADSDFFLLNTVDVQNILNNVRTTLESAAGGPGALTFIRVPVLYFGNRGPTFSTSRSGVSMTPGLQNFQPLGAEAYFPREFGPLNANGSFSGQVSIASNDSDENPFNFTVTGKVGSSSLAQIRDNSGLGFNATGGFSGYDDVLAYAGSVHYAAPGSGFELANWTFAGLTPGQYRISATWTADPNRATNAPFTILDGSVSRGTVLINQELVPSSYTESGISWQDLGGPYNLSNGTLTVRLTDSANEYVIADAIRIERLLPDVELRDGPLTTSPNIPDNIGVVSVGTTPVGTPLSKTFTVRNAGTADLTLGPAITVPAGYALVTGFGSTTLAPGATTTFTVRVNATAPGTVSGQIVFVTNDLDETPFNFTVTALVGSTSAVQILDDGAAGFEATAGFFNYPGEGYQGDVTFAAPGLGAETATWTFGVTPGQYRVAATWTTDPNRATNAPFTIFNGATQLDSPILVNQEIAPVGFTDSGADWQYLGGTFTITNSTLAVRLNDNADEYVIADAIRIERVGDLIAPEIEVRDGPLVTSPDIPDNIGLVDMGATPVGSPLTRTFTVRNVGTANLTLGAVSVPAGYSLMVGLGTTTLLPGASTTFTVRLNASDVDLYEYAATSQVQNARFSDVWNLYHRLLGELHCATVVRRTPYAFSWWSSQP